MFRIVYLCILFLPLTHAAFATALFQPQTPTWNNRLEYKGTSEQRDLFNKIVLDRYAENARRLQNQIDAGLFTFTKASMRGEITSPTDPSLHIPLESEYTLYTPRFTVNDPYSPKPNSDDFCGNGYSGDFRAVLANSVQNSPGLFRPDYIDQTYSDTHRILFTWSLLPENNTSRGPKYSLEASQTNTADGISFTLQEMKEVQCSDSFTPNAQTYRVVKNETINFKDAVIQKRTGCRGNRCTSIDAHTLNGQATVKEVSMPIPITAEFSKSFAFGVASVDSIDETTQKAVLVSETVAELSESEGKQLGINCKLSAGSNPNYIIGYDVSIEVNALDILGSESDRKVKKIRYYCN